MVSRKLENTISTSKIKPLDRSFYKRNTQIVAFELIGKVLAFHQTSLMLSGRIVETEAYFGSQDPASHAYRGVTPRNQVMFGPAGFSYVYFTYGNHHCLNVTTEQESIAGAVLIRAVEPISGVSLMKENRGDVSHQQLANGPGKLTQAFGITREHSGMDLTQDNSFCIMEEKADDFLHIQVTTRIGISRAQHRPYRFYLSDNPFVSVR